ncbi:hypothetical protein [Archangium sp.]|uniref:GspE/PulE/PilB domain-containing protein n=1 Tax=Archangium sp. TaxID=1872627 RepID=UPI00286CCD35|nr:hypothetical protein [Archangium sp.]
MQTKKRLGEILLQLESVDELQLQSALAYQRKWGVPLGQVVVDLRFCSVEQVLAALARQTGVPAVTLDAELLDPSLARLLPRKLAEMHRVVPLRVEGPRDMVLVVAIAAPASMHALDAVRSVTGKLRVVPRLATDAAISRAIERLYLGKTEAPRKPEEGEGFAVKEEPRAIRFPTLDLRQEALELPLLEPLEMEELAELLELTEVVEPEPGGVLIYGWGAAAAAGLVKVVQQAGFPARLASTADVLAADEGSVVLAPLPSLEALEQRTRAQLLVAGKVPEVDVTRAHALGARGFLAAPLDTDLMLRAVRRLLRTVGEAPPLHAVGGQGHLGSFSGRAPAEARREARAS